MITVENLSYHYPNGKNIRFPDFAVPTGKSFLLLGKSGSGKTTLLHLLGGLLFAPQGKIEIHGKNIVGLGESEMDRYRGQHFGFVFQRHHLIRSLTVRENLLLAPYLSGLQQSEQRVDEVLQQLEVADKKHSRISELSQGQAQRVAIARAVLNKPSVLLADEPTSALDDESCERVAHLLLQSAVANQSTLVVATHDQRLKSKLSNIIQL